MQFAQLCSVIHVACRLLGAAVEKAVVDEVEHGGEQRQCAAGDRRPEGPVKVHVGRRQPINVQSQRGLGVVARPRPTTEYRHGGRLHADCHRTPQQQSVAYPVFHFAGIKLTSGYAMVVHGRPKTPKNTSFGGHPAPRGRTAPIF